MIEDPPILTVRRNFPRPAADDVAALAGTPTGFIADALGGRAGLGKTVKPVDARAARFCGVAVPCHTGPADNLAFFAALHIAAPGDVIVIAADGYTGTAVIGDLALGMAKNKGVAAVVTDGAVRDLDGIEAVGLPCFAAGIVPDSPARSGPGTAGLPVTIASAAVDAGDVVIGDRDGVVVIPREKIGVALAALPAIEAAEVEREASVKAGSVQIDAVAALLSSDRVREVE